METEAPGNADLNIGGDLWRLTKQIILAGIIQQLIASRKSVPPRLKSVKERSRIKANSSWLHLQYRGEMSISTLRYDRMIPIADADGDCTVS
mmetsp:Transcript_20736/g.42669  ORF Transcript_20736/g.42669 Transcript_20736/m.42669 type:complete len:92 (-) Transcript_20736:812-1087(-)